MGDFKRFQLPELEADAVIGPNSKIRFRPPVNLQRYKLIAKIIELKKRLGGCKKIVEFGCAEIRLFKYIKKQEGVEEYIAVDIDEKLLNRYSWRVIPKTLNSISNRPNPFNVKVLCGSVADPDVRLLGSDIVIAIELIEHLYPEPLEELPYNIFGLIQPDVAVFTTPNSDFNVLFNNLIGFRHNDHKFEWSREQFQDWADNLVVRYPNYEVDVGGIGPGPPGSEHLGCCTQIAIFFRKGPRDIIDDDVCCKETYKVITNVDYPFTKPQVLLENSVKFYCSAFISSSVKFGKYRIPFCTLFDHAKFRFPACSKQQVWSIVKENWTLEEDEAGVVTVVAPCDDADDDRGSSSKWSSSDRSLVMDIVNAREESDRDAEPDVESLTVHLNETEMNEEERFPAPGSHDEGLSDVELQVPMMASPLPEARCYKAPEVDALNGNNMEENNRGIRDVMEFVQNLIQAEGDLQHHNMAEGRGPQSPDESDEEAISNTVDGSSQADSTLPMLDDDTVQLCLGDRGSAVVMGDASSVSSGPSLPITPSNTRNPSVDDLIDEVASTLNVRC